MHWKLHIAALFVAVIVVLIIANIPSETSTNGESNGNLSITITSASWGLNCTEEKDANAPFMSLSGKRSGKNNVLDEVAKLCDGKVSCSGAANTATLGADPFPECSKHLVIEYRCFSYDRPWKIDIGSEPFTIDCTTRRALQ